MALSFCTREALAGLAHMLDLPFVCISVSAALAAKAVRPVRFFRLDLMIRNLLLGLKKDLAV